MEVNNKNYHERMKNKDLNEFFEKINSKLLLKEALQRKVYIEASRKNK